jgi:hypothetical protein
MGDNKVKSKKEIIAVNIAYLQKPESYEEFPTGSFPYLPNMEGYTLRFKDFKQYEVYLVLNTAQNFSYDNPLVEEDKFVIMVINIASLNHFLNNIEQYMQTIIDVLQDVANKDAVSDRELPYGYVRDEDGNIKVNPAEAVVVKKIFKDYPSYKSIRKVAQELRTDYSFVHDVLHDARYTRMPIQIVPEVDIRRAYQVIQSNRKNPHTKKRIKRMY